MVHKYQKIKLIKTWIFFFFVNFHIIISSQFTLSTSFSKQNLKNSFYCLFLKKPENLP